MGYAVCHKILFQYKLSVLCVNQATRCVNFQYVAYSYMHFSVYNNLFSDIGHNMEFHSNVLKLQLSEISVILVIYLVDPLNMKIKL